MDYLSCVDVDILDMGKLDEIRERYEWIGRDIAKSSLPIHMPTDGYYNDVGYLLGLLEVHPASEPPDTPRNVLVYVLERGWRKAYYAIDGGWYTPCHSQLKGVVCWRELPPMPVEYVEGARK